MSKKYYEFAGSANFDNINFEWDLAPTANYVVNTYENGKLKTAIDVESRDSIVYSYQGDLVIEKREYNSFNELKYIDSYQYNSNNELTTIVEDRTNTQNGIIRTYQVTFDNKVNPYYQIWKESKLTFLDSQSGLARFNLEFYPHNIINMQDAEGNIDYNATFTYDNDNYPMTTYLNEAGALTGDSYTFEYQ